MFVLSKRPAYFWPVEVEFPIDGGKFKKETFEVKFERIPQSEADEISDKISNGEMSAKDLCKKVVIGWKSVLDENKDELPFSDSAFDELLNVSQVAKSISFAFFDSFKGAKVKN